MKKHIALGLVASTLFLAGCCTPHKTARWEYRTQEMYLGVEPEEKRQQDLNAAGKDGWEFVSVTPSPDQGRPYGVVVFKRRIQ
jgi:uncharacterized lipoprotein YajG